MADDPLLAPEPDEDFFKAFDSTQTPAAQSGALPGPVIPKWDESALDVVQGAISNMVKAHNSLNAGANKVLAETLDAPARLVNRAYKAVGGDPDSNLITEGQMEGLLNWLGYGTSWDSADKIAQTSARFGEGAALALSVLIPVAGTARVVVGTEKAAQIGLAGQAATRAERAQHIAREVIIEPWAKNPGMIAAAEVAGGAAAAGSDHVAKELGVESELARFGISTVAGIAAGAPFAIGAARGARAGSSAPGEGVPATTADDVLLQDVFSPKMAAELEQAAKADDILMRMTTMGEKIGKKKFASLHKEYEDSFSELDPKGRMWDVETRKKMSDAFHTRMEKREAPAPRAPKSTGAEAEAFLKASKDASDLAGQVNKQKVVTALTRGWVDRIGGIRAKLLAEGGDEGAHAQMNYDLSLGAPSWAESSLKGVRRDIYAGLSKVDRDDLNNMILSERYSQISAYRPGNKGPVSSPDEWKAMRGNLKNRVGDAKFADLQRRSQLYFDRIRVPLSDMKKSGLISQEEYDKLSRFQYSPIEYIDKLDPLVPIRVGKKKISISSSGIQPLTQKQKGLVDKNTENLMAHVLVRSYARMSRNKANQDLLALARRDKKNDVVSLKKRDKGWTRIQVMEAGKAKRFYMKDEFAEEWVTTPAGLELSSLKLLEASANVVRLMATGIDPEFPLKNLPRDWLYAWLAPNQTFGKTYSSFMPLGFAQLGRDLATTLPDVVRNGKRSQDYIREGGGMSFLTHGARGEMVATDKNSHWKVAKDVIGIINSRSELWTRLAIRERALRNGQSPEEATWTARTQIDFSQGGNVAKQLDQYIPYLNASIQGIRGAVRAAKQDPQGFSLKVMQAMGASSGLWAYNRMNYQEGYSQVDEETRASNFIFMLPGHYIDADGNKRYNYIKIPVEHSFAPFKAMADAMMEKYWDGKVPTREVVQGFKNGASIVGQPGQTLPPAAKALLALGNYDTWRLDNVWKGEENIPLHMEYKEFPDTPTPPIAVDTAKALADTTGIELSPARLTSAVQSVFPDNIYTLGLTSLYNKATTGNVNPEGSDTRLIPEEALMSRIPFLRSILGTTHPFANIMNDINDEVEGVRGENVLINREADKRMARIYSSKGKDAYQEKSSFDDWVRSDAVPAEDKKRILDRAISYQQVRKVFEARDTKGLPEISVWLNLTSMPADQRASAFAWMTKEADADKRARLRTMAASIPSFWTDNFVRALKTQEKKEGIK